MDDKFNVSLELFKKHNIKPELGKSIRFKTKEGEIINATISEIGKDSVTITKV